MIHSTSYAIMICSKSVYRDMRPLFGAGHRQSWEDVLVRLQRLAIYPATFSSVEYCLAVVKRSNTMASCLTPRVQGHACSACSAFQLLGTTPHNAERHTQSSIYIPTIIRENNVDATCLQLAQKCEFSQDCVSSAIALLRLGPWWCL